MPTFVYEALNEQGHLVRGVVDAQSRSLALKHLKQYRFEIRNLQRQTGFQALFQRFQKVKLASLTLFTRQLANMIKAGLPAMRCFDLLSTKGENRNFENIVLLVKEHVKAGDSFFRAFSRFPEVFSPVYLALVQAGEISGEMAQILDRLANYLEKELILRKRIRSAMVYPVVIFSTCILISVFLITYIFPQFVALFKGMQLQMPLPTRLLILSIDAIKSPIFVLSCLVVVGVVVFIFSQYLKTLIGRKHFHQWLLSIPVLGPINRKTAISRFCRTFATLFGSGVPLLQAFDIMSGVTGNEIINETIAQARETLRYGSSIATSLEASGLFPPMVVSMIQVGEESGSLRLMLEQISNYYDLEIEYTFISLTKMLEPLLILFMGLMVGFVLVSIFMPIYQLIGSFNNK